MASTKDTATFFHHGTSTQFERVLTLYPQALRLKAERKTKKPEELIKLDNWYQNELPKKIKSRGKDAHMVHEELVQTMKWKQIRGKFYPQLSYLVKVNTPRAVMAETKKAFRKLPNLEQAITALSNLKGVGTTMASALLAAACPESAPFMADECLMAIPEIEGIDYTTKEYLKFVNHIQNVVERLNKNPNTTNKFSWSPHKVELAIWTHYIVSELKPELLSSILENGNSVPNSLIQNGDSLDNTTSDESNQGPPLNGKSSGPLLDEDTNTSYTEDSLDKPSTPITIANEEETNDSIVSESTNDSRSSNNLGFNTKRRIREEEEDEDNSSSVDQPNKKVKDDVGNK
ncbi:uncharacterized protein [Onthophagus taurus]|uniref:uncharacterized protein n=1 Tax=Onthophagus taurus TaxID=166361 RepID=UPI000C1FFA83|nr:uncharacterized protein LOC111417996 [Onthophagus taurus]XP_022906203.1 uncharacterized protein LOC111417996 [Onthophagus taurus]